MSKAPAAAGEVIKSDLGLLSPYQSTGLGIEGELYWPVDPLALLALYLNSPEHCRAVHVKAAGAFGKGLVFERDADRARFEALLPTGSADLFESQGLDQETYGNDWLEIVRDGRKRILRLAHLPAIHMHRLSGGRAVQRYKDGDKEITTDFHPNETLHSRAPCPGGATYSYPSWAGGAGMMQLAQAAIDYNTKFFSNSAIPEYAIVTKGFELSETQKQATRDFFRHEFQGVDNPHRTLYLHLPDKEHEIDFRRVTAETKDGDFLKLLDAARDRIPIAHGVPPRMLGIMQAGQLGGGSEVVGQLDVFEKLTLAPLRRKRIEQLAPLLKELGIKPAAVRFEGLDLTPPDVDRQTLHGQLAAWVQAGLITEEEARAAIADTVPGLTKAAGASDTAILASLLGRL